MKIKDIYGELRKFGLTCSQVEFSRIWLGRSDRYYSYLIASQREPGLATLNGIWWRIDSLVRSSPTRIVQLEPLKDAIAADIARRAITDRQRRSGRMRPLLSTAGNCSGSQRN
jgi:hypothetical protein